MDPKSFAKRVQQLLNLMGHNLAIDGDPGNRTEGALEFEIQRLRPKAVPFVNPAYERAQKEIGKQETDSKFGAWLSTFWPKVGLKNYKTIVGTTFAWCGLFIFAMNTEVGQKSVAGAAAAISWQQYGQKIDWKKNGIPRGAVMHLNGAGNCKSSSGNHVTFADGDCTPEDLTKVNATVPGLGGNQQNQVKRSVYSMKNVCYVGWPSEIKMPPPITKSNGCTGKYIEESTR